MTIKQLGMVLLVSAASCAFADRLPTPEVSNVKMTQNTGSEEVTISYVLSNAPAIVTVDIQTQGEDGTWRSIGAENVRDFSADSDVFKKITTNGSHKMKMQTKLALPKVTTRAVVKAWAIDNPPDYYVVDLANPGVTAYYPEVGNLPGGLLENPVYRTSALVFRRIHAAGVPWAMGSIFEKNRDATREHSHIVTLDKDYYIGVFEVTQAQYKLFAGATPAYFKVDGDMRPVEKVSYGDIRTKAVDVEPSSGTALYKIRKLTGLNDIELPSEAQWDFACRAGTGEGQWASGAPYLATEIDEGVQSRYWRNGGGVGDPEGTLTKPDATVTPENGTAIVGSYKPNAWGLYDMNGNVAEWCLDKYTANISANVTGEVILGTGNRVVRGGSWQRAGTLASTTPSSAGNRTAIRLQAAFDLRDTYIGFRLVCKGGLE